MSRSEPQTAYEILGVSPFDEFETIRQAWRALVRETHPDIATGDRLAATRRLALINGAFDALRFHKETAAAEAARRARVAAAQQAEAERRATAEAAERAAAARRAEADRRALAARRAQAEQRAAARRAAAQRRAEAERQAAARRAEPRPGDGRRRSDLPPGPLRSAAERYAAACDVLAAQPAARSRVSVLMGALA